MRSRFFMILGLLLTCLGACRNLSSDNAAESGSSLHYIIVQPGWSGLTGAVKKKQIKICLRGVSDSAREKWESNITKSIMKWIEPLRSMTSDELSQGVEFTKSASDCDGKILVYNTGRSAFAMTGAGTPEIHIPPTGNDSGFNVIFHEMGHAFGLGDTYYGGISGQCQPGHDLAVMCSRDFTDLKEDDINGVRAVFKRAFPKDNPHAGIKLPTTTRVSMFAAIGREIATDRHELRFSALGDEAFSGEMSYCLNSLETCKKSSSWISASQISRSSKAVIYGSNPKEGLELGKLSEFVVRHSFEKRESYLRVRFERGN